LASLAFLEKTIALTSARSRTALPANVVTLAACMAEFANAVAAQLEPLMENNENFHEFQLNFPNYGF
jgi:hypothetical protein